MDSNLDKRLRDYLASEERDRLSGNTIANLRLEVHQFRSELEEVKQAHQEIANDQRKLTLRVDRHGRDIRSIKQRLEYEDADIDTGQHQVDDLKRALATKEAEIQERKEESLWWKRSVVKWIVAGAAWIFTTFIAALIALSLHTPKPSTTPPAPAAGQR